MNSVVTKWGIVINELHDSSPKINKQKPGCSVNGPVNYENSFMDNFTHLDGCLNVWLI